MFSCCSSLTLVFTFIVGYTPAFQIAKTVENIKPTNTFLSDSGSFRTPLAPLYLPIFSAFNEAFLSLRAHPCFVYRR